MNFFLQKQWKMYPSCPGHWRGRPASRSEGQKWAWILLYLQKQNCMSMVFFETVFFCIIFFNVTNVFKWCQLISRPEFWLNARRILMPPAKFWLEKLKNEAEGPDCSFFFYFSGRTFADGTRILQNSSRRPNWILHHLQY